eukprot:scaffold765_cov345-Prasinococcus_capsulatus_cf.AAC.6
MTSRPLPELEGTGRRVYHSLPPRLTPDKIGRSTSVNAGGLAGCTRFCMAGAPQLRLAGQHEVASIACRPMFEAVGALHMPSTSTAGLAQREAEHRQTLHPSRDLARRVHDQRSPNEQWGAFKADDEVAAFINRGVIPGSPNIRAPTWHCHGGRGAHIRTGRRGRPAHPRNKHQVPPGACLGWPARKGVRGSVQPRSW